MSKRCLKAKGIKEQREGSGGGSPMMHSSDEKASVAEIGMKTACGMVGLGRGFSKEIGRGTGQVFIGHILEAGGRFGARIPEIEFTGAWQYSFLFLQFGMHGLDTASH